MKPAFTLLIIISLSSNGIIKAQQVRSDGDDSFSDGDHQETPSPMFLVDMNDGGISGINSVPSFQCNEIITPTVVIENFGSQTLTSATLEYYVDGGSPQFFFWVGSLPPYWMDTLTLPAMNVTSGTHMLDIMVIEANGQADFNDGNNGSIEFNVVGSGDQLPYSEPFDLQTLPPGYFVVNENNGPTWSSFSLGQNLYMSCARMPFYINDASGDIDDLYMQNFDLSNSATAQLSFDVAYAYYSEFYWDELKVMVSGNCGNDWEVIYDKQKDDLATAPPTDVPYVPLPAQWRNEVVDLSAYSGNSNVIIKLEAVSGHGNNLYVDNIAISSNTGVNDPAKKNAVSLFPNPANSSVKVSWHQMNSSGSELKIFSSLGQPLYASHVRSSPAIIPVDKLSAGAYMISITSENGQQFTAPLIVFH